MKKKYWVPSIERADSVLKIINKYPGKYRLIDLSIELDINKSSLFSLLNTLEVLGWVVKKGNDTYDLGSTLGTFNSTYLKQFNLIQSFYKEAQKSILKVNEPIQLGTLEGIDVVYLGKVNNDSNIRLVTDPGMRYPSYASAIGKIQMIDYSYEEIEEIFSNCKWVQKTDYTTASLSELFDKIKFAKKSGYSVESEESALGFHCVAAPVYNFEREIIAGVSFSMPTNSWNEKFEKAKDEIINLSASLSKLAGCSKGYSERYG